MTLTDQEYDDALERAEFKGWCAALDKVRDSLRNYPNGGGDIEIMREVEKILIANKYESI